MSIRAWSLGVTLTAGLLALGGCNDVTTHVENQAAPAQPALSVAFSPAPPSSVAVSSSTSFAATVNNDSTNAGVDWTLTCASPGNCGSLGSLHTASGQQQTYTAPPTISSNSQSASIVAFASADHSKNLTTTLNVTAFGSILSGTYVFETTGYDTSNNPYQRAGVIVLDGNGDITAGEQTVNFMNPNTSTMMTVVDAITGGSYFVGPDGRGSLVINTADQNVGVNGIETFTILVLSNSQVLIAATLDSASGAQNEVSAGEMDLQTAVAAPTAGYAFVTYGATFGQNVSAFAGSMALGGIINIDSPQTISGNGSTVDEANNDFSGAVVPGSPGAGVSAVSGTVSVPDTFGAVQITLNVPLFSSTPIQFTGYIVDSSHMKLIESDDTSGNGFGVTTGIAIGQGSATGTFTTKERFDGTYVFGLLGQDTGSAPFSLSSAGTFVASGGRIYNGFVDETQTDNGIEFSTPLHGFYTVDLSGTGRADTGSSPGTLRLVQGQFGPGELVFYQTGNGGPALVLDADIESTTLPTGFSGGGLATGLAYPVQANPSFAGDYGLNLLQSSLTDGTGQIVANNPSINGAFDFPGNLNVPVTGTFAASTTNNRLTGTLLPKGLNQVAVAIYLIDANHGFVVETDAATTGSGTFSYFATRTPVCQSCP